MTLFATTRALFVAPKGLTLAALGGIIPSPQNVTKMGNPRISLIGRRFNRLTVIALSKVEYVKSGSSVVWWECLCTCGNIKAIRGSTLTRGHCGSCGCLHSELSRARLQTHGMTHTPEYNAWTAMRGRCNPTTSHKGNYKNYVCRSIKVCPQWQGVDGFSNFLAHVGPRPSPEHSLDRYPNNNGNYEPGNVRWATKKEQNNNKRQVVPLETSRYWAWERYAESIGA